MAKDLIGRPYGDTYEIKDGGLSVVKATLNEIGECGTARSRERSANPARLIAEETAANNENISSVGAQKLTFFDIETLRSEGLSGRVRALCAAWGTFLTTLIAGNHPATS